MNVRHRRWMTGLAAMVGLLATLALGRWQLQRAAQKEALQSQATQAAQLPVLDSHDWVAWPATDVARQRRARVHGRWLPQHTRWLDNRMLDGRAGYVVVTPLQIEPGSQVLLVQRGWTPRDANDRHRTPLPPTPDGEVELVGELTPLPGHRMELGRGRETGPIRQNIDLDELTRACGKPVWMLTLQQTSDSADGLVRRWPQRDAGVATHYGYAAQWFALSLLIVILYGWFQIRPALRS